jgi:hypothetical protein
MWKYTLDEPFGDFFRCLDDIRVTEPFLVIDSGFINIPEGYSWNGCSMALDFKGTYYASLIHDALYQYKVNRAVADRVFYEKMKEDKFKLAGLYYIAVRLFGWMYY